jgi:hypothetical protein
MMTERDMYAEQDEEDWDGDGEAAIDSEGND